MFGLTCNISIENSTVQIHLQRGLVLTLCNIYIRKDLVLVSHLQSCLPNLFNLGNQTVLIGEWKSYHTSWNAHSNDYHGTAIYDHCINNAIEIFAPPSPTRFSPATGDDSTIDFALLDDVSFQHDISVHQGLNSDHLAIQVNFS